MTFRFLRVALLVALAWVPLLGAADVRPAPVVVVYPLTLTGGTNPEAGSNIAVLFSTKIAEGGGLVVKPPTPGTDRAHFLEAAKALGADYYVTGYLTPLGQDVSMLAQVVSTYSGTVVYSTTAVVSTYAEAGAQADLLREAILHHAGRGLASLDQAAPTSTPVPTASEVAKEGALTNLTSIFHHKKAAATPAASAQPAPTSGTLQVAAAASPAPSPVSQPTPALTPAPAALSTSSRAGSGHRGTLVLAIAGADQSTSDRVATALAASLNHHGVTTARSAAAIAAHPTDNAAQLCATAADTGMLYAGTLTIDKNTAGEATSVELDVTGYDCNGNPIVHESAQSATSVKGGVLGALDLVAESAGAALARHPHAALFRSRADLRAAT